MGSVSLPTAGIVYLDTQSVIYSVEKHPQYAPALRPLWVAAKSGSVRLVTSELTLLETLVGPLKSGDIVFAAAYERLLGSADLNMLPVTLAVLREAARLRSSSSLDARRHPSRHRNSRTSVCCVTNDAAFRKVPGIQVLLIDSLIAP